MFHYKSNISQKYVCDVMSEYNQKIFSFFIILQLLIVGNASIIGLVYEPSVFWCFESNCYFDFSEQQDFVDGHRKGFFNDSSLVGYWRFDEGDGSVAYDYSGNELNANYLRC